MSDQEIEKKGVEPDKIRTDSSEEGLQTNRGEGEIIVRTVAKDARDKKSTKIVIRDIIDINQNRKEKKVYKLINRRVLCILL